jgi:hypothetical protein
LLLAVTTAQVAVWIALRVMPLHSVRDAARRCRVIFHSIGRASDRDVIRAIEGTGRRLGRTSSCLVRAIVAESILASADSGMQLVIGVRHGAAGNVEAHAWVTRNGCEMMGSAAAYRPLAAWDCR